MPINLPIKWIMAGIAALVTFIGFKIKLLSAKKEGRQEIINQNLKLDYGKILDFDKKKEVIREKEDVLKSCVPNDWDAVSKLRQKGIYKLSDIPASGVCEEVQGQNGPNKTTDPS